MLDSATGVQPVEAPRQEQPSDWGATARKAVAKRPWVGAWCVAVGAGAMWTYASFVFVYMETIGGVVAGPLVTCMIIVTEVTVSYCVAKWFLTTHPTRVGVAVNGGLALGVMAATLVAVDLLYGAYANWLERHQAVRVGTADHVDDQRIWAGELYPVRYYPTERNFLVHKPNVHVSGQTYGGFYHPDMLASTTLKDSVLDLRFVRYHIGPLGFRETSSLAGSRLVALGDSFVFGYSTDEGNTWSDFLTESLGETVYNLGVAATAPAQQLMLLEHVLASHGDSVQMERLLWMIFEGNDLEGDYDQERASDPERAGRSGVFGGTILESVASVPIHIKNSSILRKAMMGNLMAVSGPRGRGAHPYDVDGVPLRFPLYHSERWGFRLFETQQVERATRPVSYVMNHPNIARLEETMSRMEALSRNQGFHVTVLLAPSAARLYGSSFSGFPAVSAAPHLLDRVREFAHAAGFEVIDLLAEMRPYAAEQLLYYRDDPHWNVMGNLVVARIVERALTDSPSAMDELPPTEKR